MRRLLAPTILGLLVLTPAPLAGGAGADRPRVALAISPARLTLAAPGSTRINVRNDGAERVVVDVARRFVTRPGARTWLQITPSRLVLRPGRSAGLAVRARGAEPGDHHVLVLLTSRALRGSRVGVRVRLGARVVVHVPGRVVRHLTLGRLRLDRVRRARLMFVSVANRGNVTVQLRGRLTASLSRRGRLIAPLRPTAQPALAPGAHTMVGLRYAKGVRGPLTVVVRVRAGSRVRLAERRYRIRL
jgi:hypothetical protein